MENVIIVNEGLRGNLVQEAAYARELNEVVELINNAHKKGGYVKDFTGLVSRMCFLRRILGLPLNI